MINQDRLLFLSPTVESGREKEACMDEFEPMKPLGAGAFGKVLECKHKKSKQIYAIKQINKK